MFNYSAIVGDVEVLPVVLFDWFADAFGINKAMKTFRGRR
jgi:hypothetical protein